MVRCAVSGNKKEKVAAINYWSVTFLFYIEGLPESPLTGNQNRQEQIPQTGKTGRPCKTHPDHETSEQDGRCGERFLSV